MTAFEYFFTKTGFINGVLGVGGGDRWRGGVLALVGVGVSVLVLVASVLVLVVLLMLALVVVLVWCSCIGVADGGVGSGVGVFIHAVAGSRGVGVMDGFLGVYAIGVR